MIALLKTGRNDGGRMNMKIAIIGSSQYLELFMSVRDKLLTLGNDVRTPAFDSHPEFNELQVCEYNRSIIEWADRIHIIWDQRSMGTVFDFGMVFMARKPIVIEYIEPKTFRGVMEKYEHEYQV